MTHEIMVLGDGTVRIAVSFRDEGVDLSGVTHIRGSEADALRYLPVFEQDLRRNFAHLFPLPPPAVPVFEEGMI